NSLPAAAFTLAPPVFTWPRARLLPRSVYDISCHATFFNLSYPTPGWARVRHERTSAMPKSALSYQSADGTKIVAYRWDPQDVPRAAIQLTHGMGEHAQRYDHVAQALNDAGFVVYAQDHRGHGASGDPDAYGNLGPGGWTALVDDIGQLSAIIREDHADLPLILIGHSMGSF